MARYDSLQDLVMGCDNMLKLYPDIAKETAFADQPLPWGYTGPSMTTPPPVVRYSEKMVDSGWGSLTGTEPADEDEDNHHPGLMLTDSDSDTALPEPE